jgi:hypothetical protein
MTKPSLHTRALALLAVFAVAVGLPAASFGPAGAATAQDVFAFGDAAFLGSTGATVLAHPIVGMSATPHGHGYWLVASDGGIFSFGDAHFHGSTGAIALNQPIVGMAATRNGGGYWLVAADGGMFSFGRAPFFGSAGGTALTAPVTGMAVTHSGNGYWIAARDGRVFGYGDASRAASPHTTTPAAAPSTGTVVGIAPGPDARGYWLAASTSAVSNPKIEPAIAWFESRMGSSAFEGLCETAVENAFGTSSQYPTARANWNARPDQHTDWWNAPRGALVFYDTSASGHVAISLGDGTVISTSINGRIGIAPVGFLQNPLGWARAPW